MKRLLKYTLAALFLLNLALAAWFGLSPWAMDKALLVVALDRLFAVVYRDDLTYVRQAQKSYLRGDPPYEQPMSRWEELAKEHPDFLLVAYQGAERMQRDVPFVYQSPELPHLRELRERFQLPQMAARYDDEYRAMLEVFGWVGTRFQHGADAVPGGAAPMDPLLVLDGGSRGGKYWCEIAAKLSVEVASALGWPARLVTASRDGYVWEHAVAEVWSNRFNKWFVVDDDYNLVYESQGVPLSAWELCHLGPLLKQQGRLTPRRLAPLKRGLRDTELIHFYRYVHIDLRNDWFTRKLRRLSPSGGDQSTWWTAREGLGVLLTAKRRVDARERFDWKLNQVVITPVEVQQRDGKKTLDLALCSYSPYFDRFEAQVNGRTVFSRSGRISLRPERGLNEVSARVVDRMGNRGPIFRVSFLWRNREVGD